MGASSEVRAVKTALRKAIAPSQRLDEHAVIRLIRPIRLIAVQTLDCGARPGAYRPLTASGDSHRRRETAIGRIGRIDSSADGRIAHRTGAARNTQGWWYPVGPSSRP